MATPLFIESIRFLNGEPQLLDLHIERMERTLRAHGLPQVVLPDLAALCPEENRQGVAKCRLLYREEICEVTFAAYQKRTIHSVALAQLPHGYTYTYKTTDRAILDELRSASSADEVILVHSDGWITDSSYSNLVFLREGIFYTPSTPLLSGVQRTHLLREGRIVSLLVDRSALTFFSHVGFINAMLPLEEMPLVSLSEIHSL